MIDLKDYADKKKLGLVSIVKTDADTENGESTTYAVSYKKWDAATGERLSDEVIGVSVKELEDRKAELAEQMAELTLFWEDAKAAT